MQIIEKIPVLKLNLNNVNIEIKKKSCSDTLCSEYNKETKANFCFNCGLKIKEHKSKRLIKITDLLNLYERDVLKFIQLTNNPFVFNLNDYDDDNVHRNKELDFYIYDDSFVDNQSKSEDPCSHSGVYMYQEPSTEELKENEEKFKKVYKDLFFFAKCFKCRIYIEKFYFV